MPENVSNLNLLDLGSARHETNPSTLASGKFPRLPDPHRQEDKYEPNETSSSSRFSKYARLRLLLWLLPLVRRILAT